MPGYGYGVEGGGVAGLTAVERGAVGVVLLLDAEAGRVVGRRAAEDAALVGVGVRVRVRVRG